MQVYFLFTQLCMYKPLMLQAILCAATVKREKLKLITFKAREAEIVKAMKFLMKWLLVFVSYPGV